MYGIGVKSVFFLSFFFFFAEIRFFVFFVFFGFFFQILPFSFT